MNSCWSEGQKIIIFIIFIATILNTFWTGILLWRSERMEREKGKE